MISLVLPTSLTGDTLSSIPTASSAAANMAYSCASSEDNSKDDNRANRHQSLPTSNKGK